MNHMKQPRKPSPRTPVRIVVGQEFVGDKSISEAFIPVIVEDIRRKAEQARTFDNRLDGL